MLNRTQSPTKNASKAQPGAVDAATVLAYLQANANNPVNVYANYRAHMKSDTTQQWADWFAQANVPYPLDRAHANGMMQFDLPTLAKWGVSDFANFEANDPRAFVLANWNDPVTIYNAAVSHSITDSQLRIAVESARPIVAHLYPWPLFYALVVLNVTDYTSWAQTAQGQAYLTTGVDVDGTRIDDSGVRLPDAPYVYQPPTQTGPHGPSSTNTHTVSQHGTAAQIATRVAAQTARRAATATANAAAAAARAAARQTTVTVSDPASGQVATQITGPAIVTRLPPVNADNPFNVVTVDQLPSGTVTVTGGTFKVKPWMIGLGALLLLR